MKELAAGLVIVALAACHRPYSENERLFVASILLGDGFEDGGQSAWVCSRALVYKLQSSPWLRTQSASYSDCQGRLMSGQLASLLEQRGVLLVACHDDRQIVYRDDSLVFAGRGGRLACVLDCSHDDRCPKCSSQEELNLPDLCAYRAPWDGGLPGFALKGWPRYSTFHPDSR